MNSNTREKIFATKEKLHQLTQLARDEEGEKEEERERARAEQKARDNAEYLRRHNKTVTKVLSQVAKGNRVEDTSGEEELDKEEGEDTDDWSDQEEKKQHGQKSGLTQRESSRGEKEAPTASTSTSTGKSRIHYSPLSAQLVHTGHNTEGCLRRLIDTPTIVAGCQERPIPWWEK